MVEEGGRVSARFVFASAEPLGQVVTSSNIAAVRSDLSAFVLDGVEVSADGTRCAATFHDASLSELDGLILDASYRCPEDAAEIGVVLYYLSALPSGHREIARIVAGSASTEAVLTGDRRALALRLPGDRPAAAAARRRRGRQLVGLATTFAAAFLALLVWRLALGRRR